MSTTSLSGAQEYQKRVLDILGLALKMVVNHHVGAGSQIWVLCKSNVSLTTETIL